MNEFMAQYFCITGKKVGQSFAEYGLVFALICVVTMAVLKTISN